MTKKATKEVWQDRIARWQESRMTAEEFALREGVQPSSLKWWRWRLGSEVVRAGAGEQRPAKGATAFVEVAPEPAPSAPERSAATFEVLLGNGRVVRVPPGFSDEELVRVIAAAERGLR